jgi:hypothetical protein
VVIVFDEGLDLCFEVAGQEVVVEQDVVLQRLMPALALALGLWMEGCAAHIAHFLPLDPVCQISRNIAGTIA